MKIALFAFAATLVFTPAVVFGQTATTAPTTTATAPTKPATINQRKEDQQDRIAQGVKSGQLTAGETSRIEHQESGINKEESGMRAEDNGKLSKQDKKTLNSQQNQESRRIYRARHNTHIQK